MLRKRTDYLKEMYMDTIEFWLEHLDPSEVAFVMLFLKDMGDKEIIINEGMGKGEATDDSPESDDDPVDFDSNLTLVNYEKRYKPYSTFLTGSYSGSYSGGSPGTYWDPPEPPDYNVDDITIESITVLDDDGDAFEITKEINGKNLGFTYENLACTAASVVANYLPGDTTSQVDKFIKDHRLSVIPSQLIKKIEDIYKKNDGFLYKMTAKKFKV